MRCKQQPTALLLVLLLALTAGASARRDDAVSGQCNNKRRDGSETDVDCGGGECSRRCALRQSCRVGSDCVTGTCDPDSRRCGCPGGLTLAPGTLTCYSEQSTCYNGRKDGKETDRDCGGPCIATGRRCPLFSNCARDADCQSNSCSRSNLGQTGQTGQTRSYLTCTCPPSQRLSPDRTRCVAIPTAELAGAFKDVTPMAGSPPPPCALTAVKCGLGDTCRTAADCRSGNCEQQSNRCICPAGFVAQQNNAGCRPAVISRNDLCWNGLKDHGETDVDCGGSTCWKCSNGLSCKQASDCSSLNCDTKTKKCSCPPGSTATPSGLCLTPAAAATGNGTCYNGNFDPGFETDIDCGLTCPKGCTFGHSCRKNSDCAAANSVCNSDQRICMCPRGQYISPDNMACLTAAQLCFNGAKDAEESDVDCGGSCSSKCKFGQFCSAPTDCETGICISITTTTTSGSISTTTSSRTCGCPSTAPMSRDGSKCLTRCDTGANPCRNGGTCLPNFAVANSSANFRCSCPSNYVGTLCETRLSTCNISNPCRNGGACIPMPGYTPGKGGPDFRCYCKAGYSGAMCEVVKSTCFAASSVCRNGGTCITLPGQMPDFSCNCTKGWSGLTCTDRASQQQQQNACQPRNPCQNGGSCQPQPGQPPGYYCSCAGGFEGQDCEVDIAAADAEDSAAVDAAIAEQDHIAGLTTDPWMSSAPADSNPNSNSISRDGPSTCDFESPCGVGECVPAPGEDPDYTCSCPSGYWGKLCQIKDLTTCEISPDICSNGGECVPVEVPANDFDTPDYECSCAGGYSGTNCEVAPAAATATGQSGSTGATAGSNMTAAGGPNAAVTASANGGVSATAVTSARTTCASSSPCRNGGSCTPRPGSVPDYTCTCPTGFSGMLCQEKANTCSIINPCVNRGACMPMPGSSPDFRCSCSGGFAGTLCETDCYAKQQVSDPSGKTCVEAADLVSSSSSSLTAGTTSTTTTTTMSSSGAGVSAPTTPCGATAGRKCTSGEPCRSNSDCESGDCKVFSALDNTPRCSCPSNSFIFLAPNSNAAPRCVSQAEMCSNKVRDPYEGDTDCGFYCQKLCGLGQACRGGYGCSSGHCNLQTGKCECSPGYQTRDGVTCVPKV